MVATVVLDVEVPVTGLGQRDLAEPPLGPVPLMTQFVRCVDGHPGDAADKDLYDLPPEVEKGIPTVAHSLDVALDALSGDREFLKAGGVMTDDVIDAYIELKSEEVQRLLQATHPAEFELYYSV